MKKTIFAHIENRIVVKEETKTLKTYCEYDPGSIKGYFVYKFRNFKDTEIMWVTDFKLYHIDILKLLFLIKYKDVTAENLKIKDMPANSFKYIVGENGNIYALYVRHQKKTLYMYNTDNLLANLDYKEVLKTWGNGDATLKALADATYIGINALSGFQLSKTPYTISMKASREWRKIEGLYKCDNLCDMKSYASPDKSETLAVYLRRSYQAGWNYCALRNRKEYQNKGGYVYDFNSLYPYVASTKPLPWGAPKILCEETYDKIKDDNDYYYFIRVKVQFDIKSGSFPYIQKRGDFLYHLRDYLETSDIIITGRDGKPHTTSSIIGLDGKRKEVYPEFVFSKTDWELIQRHYNIRQYEIIDGVYFRTSRCVFKDFVNHYYKMKQDATKEKDLGKRRVSKMIMNSVIGTLAKRQTRQNVIYTQTANGNLQFTTRREDVSSECYIHIASAILSYAREITYEAACRFSDRFLYSDTDSLHVFGREPLDIKTDPDKMGYWKLEHTFDDAFYFKRKSYVLVQNDKWHEYDLTMAGVAENYKILIQDILDGVPESEIVRNARRNKYGMARQIFDHKPQWERRFGNWEEIDEPVKDYYRFYRFMNEVQDAPDRTNIMNFATYPTGVDSCENFIITQTIMWLSMRAREEARKAGYKVI